MAYECELIEQQARPTLVVRLRTAVERFPEVLGPAWGSVMACAGKVGATPTDAPFVAYYNMDMQDLDIEVGFTFAQPLEGEGDVRQGEIPTCKAVQCMHMGPYDEVGSAYEVMAMWIAEHGLQHAGPSFEFYLNDPQETPPAELLTRVVIPVR